MCPQNVYRQDSKKTKIQNEMKIENVYIVSRYSNTEFILDTKTMVCLTKCENKMPRRNTVTYFKRMTSS